MLFRLRRCSARESAHASIAVTPSALISSQERQSNQSATGGCMLSRRSIASTQGVYPQAEGQRLRVAGDHGQKGGEGYVEKAAGMMQHA